MDFTVIIPTYRREEDLNNCLASVLRQTLLPSAVLVIDDDALPEDYVAAWRDKFAARDATFTHYRKDHVVERRGLSESKNRALTLVTTPVFFVFDDDVVLEAEFCERVMAVWEERGEDAELIGVGGVISNHRPRTRREKLFHRFFGLGSAEAWDVNPVGFQVWDDDLQGRSVGHYAHGGACSYDLAKARILKFTVFSGGRTALEDVDFCARAKQRGWHFVIEPAARLAHYPTVVSREGDYVSGQKESANRREIFRTLNPRPTLTRRLWFAWASTGWVLRQLLAGHWQKSRGLLRG